MPDPAGLASSGLTETWRPFDARYRGHVGSPLRPNAEDVRIFTDIVGRWCGQHPGKAPDALILGVTSELYRLPWPQGTRVRAIDQAEEMIREVWPGPRDAVTHANWLDMPFPPGSIDIMLCDGGLHLVRYPDHQGILAGRIADVLAPGGLCAFRLFVPPQMRQTTGEVLDDLLAGKVRDMNCLKPKLGMAMQTSASAGVRLRDVWAALHARIGDPATFVLRHGWSGRNYHTIDAYRDSDAVYHFVTLSEVTALFAQASGGRLEFSGSEAPAYEMGDQFPVVVFRKTAEGDGG